MIYRDIYLDTNVLIDYCLPRATSASSIGLIEKSIFAEVNLHISISSVCTLLYLCEKGKISPDKSRQLLIDISEAFNLLDTPQLTLKEAARSSFLDMEDALMYYTAVSHGCDAFVTGNSRDFPQPHDIPVFTPAQMFDELT